MIDETTNSVMSSLGKISTDTFGIVGIVVLLIALSLTQSKKIPIVLLISLYPAALLTQFFPFYGTVPFVSDFLSGNTEQLTLFVISVTGCFYSLKNYITTQHHIRTPWRFVEATVLSVAVVGLTLAILYHVVGIEHFYNFSTVVDGLFASPTALWLWLVAPLVSVPLFKRA